MKTEVRVVRRLWAPGVEVLVCQSDFHGTITAVGRNIVMETIEPGLLIEEPTFRLDDRAAQALIDELWQLGYRPAGGRQSEGAMTAQGAHLADMRALAFAKLGVPQP